MRRHCALECVLSRSSRLSAPLTCTPAIPSFPSCPPPLCVALTSVLILLFNKTILTTYSFKFPFTMALSHMVVGLVLLHALKMARVIKYAAFDITLAKKALPVSLCFIVNVVIGMVALRGTNIPMFA